MEKEVALVELAPLDSPALVLPAVAAAVGVTEQAGRSTFDGLVDTFRSGPGLLVLDNCEHVLDAVAPLANDLLRACPDLHMLTTSREPLGVPGEIAWRVPPLPVPASDELEVLASSDAARLFEVRAQAVQRQFALSATNAGPVAQICRRLDGLPLAIELAAARTSALAPADIAERVQRAMGLLVGDGRTGSLRQRTLEAAIGWSYDLLAADEQQLFERLAVFAGGFSLADAEAMATYGGTNLDTLTRLVAKSLVQAEPRADGSMRYRLLEPRAAGSRRATAARRGMGARPRLVSRRRVGRGRDSPCRDFPGRRSALVVQRARAVQSSPAAGGRPRSHQRLMCTSSAPEQPVRIGRPSA